MDKIKVSVLTYVKNDSSHIEQCMRSVMAQEMKELEYLVIDGGSTDGTRDIIENLAKEDDRIRVIDSDPGLGHQFNVGVKEAVGEYIGVCESDDFVLPGMYEYQYEIAKQNDVDMLRADAYDFFAGADGECRIPFSLPGVAGLKNRLLMGDDASKAFAIGVNRFFSGLYKRSFLVDNDLFMNETPGAAYQDNTFAFITLISAKRIYISDRAFYCYRLDNPNASCNSPDRLNLVDVEYRLMRERLIKTGKWKANKERYLSWLILNHLWFCNLLSDDYRLKEVGIFYDSLAELAGSDEFDVSMIRDKERAVFDAVLSSRGEFESLVLGSCAGIEKAREEIGSLKPDDKVVIFGCGNIGKLVYHTLVKRGISPVCFTDNNSSLWGTKIGDVPVLPPEDACKTPADKRYVVANVEHSAEICSQLGGYGIDISGLIICDSYDFTARRILMGADAR